MTKYPAKKLTIIGGGIIGAMEAYYAFLDAGKNQHQIRISIYEKNADITHSTASNIVPSLSPDEILSVVPRGHILIEKLGLLFNQPGGIRVNDVQDVNETAFTEEFVSNVKECNKNSQEFNNRIDVLLKLGKISMDLWQAIYDGADLELRQILIDANFKPCHEQTGHNLSLDDGYRINLISNTPNAAIKIIERKNYYLNLGFTKCKILSPNEVTALNPFLTDFCKSHSETSKSGELVWKNDSLALYSPGGCLDTGIFLPKFYAYLEKIMGTYINNARVQKNCFRLKFARDLNKIIYHADNVQITGLKYNQTIKTNVHQYDISEYVFCPGEAVGTLKGLGFMEPSCAGFAGAALKLSIPVAPTKLKKYTKFNHCMEVSREGIVLAWQAKFKDNKISIGVGGTKAFYADKKPHKDEAFAKDRNLLQLNIINDILPKCISIALQRDTTGQELSFTDLEILEKQGIAKRWVGRRAVAYDGFPTLGNIYNAKGRIANARCTTHLGSGGVSFAPAAVMFSRSTLTKKPNPDIFTQQIITCADSRRGLPRNTAKL